MTEGPQKSAIRAVVELADHVHWVREWPTKPSWRDRIHRYFHPEAYRFDVAATPPKPWIDRPADPYEKEGWRIRAAYVGSNLVFEVSYVTCHECALGWVDWPYSHPGYERHGLASSSLGALRRAYPGLEWHTGSGHFRDTQAFWIAVGADVSGKYSPQERCPHVTP